MQQKWPRLIFDCPWLLCGLWIVFTLKNSRSLMKYLCDIWLFQFDYCADTFCLISASTRARIIGELDQQTMKVDLKDHAGPFICLCLNADSPRCQTVHLYTWWAIGKLINLLIILSYLFLFINILIILINCTPVHMVGNAHGQTHKSFNHS